MNSNTTNRIPIIDVLRGMVMILMALDHARDFLHADAFLHDPLDLDSTSYILFFTRWVTNFCAPVFILLAGISAALVGFRKGPKELSSFLFKRGLWLILAELTIVGFAWTFDITFQLVVFQVIWAIGISMVLMAALVWLPALWIGLLGLLIVGAHNVLDAFPSTHEGLIWDLLHNGDFAMHPIVGTHTLGIIYPFLPWLGVMLCGYWVGQTYAPGFDVTKRKRILLGLGTALLLGFVILRAFNGYGDPHGWTSQSSGGYTLLSFIKLHKYPPSLLFLMLHLGPAFLLLGLFDQKKFPGTRFFSVIGSVPFFYYILHLYVIHSISMLFYYLRGFHQAANADLMQTPFKFVVPGQGCTLWQVYLIWMAVVLLLYPLCIWFSGIRKRYDYWWLKYL